ncbi:MAG: hypothetical protein B7Y70_14605 [Rhizobiales bacterium 35-68-8]|nr:MAG: hypothetical protein B7Y70_14605 [Rhizobiales bacterium 35-68-8]
MRRTRLALPALLLAILLAPSGAGASSDAAWAEMRKTVEAACLKAASGHFARATALVDPFGSERFGLALLRGPAKGDGGRSVQMICVYDKRAGTVELGSELPVAP